MPIINNIVYSVFDEFGQLICIGPQIENPLREDVHKFWCLAPSFEASDKMIVHCTLESHLGEHFLIVTIRHILETVDCGSRAGAQHIYQGFLCGLGMFGLQLHFHDVIYLNDDRLLSHVAEL